MTSSSPTITSSEGKLPTVKPKPTRKPENPQSAVKTIAGNGTFSVPGDVKPGTYKTDGGDFCYWARLRSLDGEFSSIIANNISPTGPQTVTIKSTDKGFKTTSCGLWRKVR